jgi:phage major head subunit gpT-like protein
MSSVSSNLNPNVVKTALDSVFVQNFDAREKHPQYATAESATVFNQDSVDRAAVITEIFAGTGAWEERAEEQDVPQANALVDDQQTFSVVNYAQSVDITKNFFDDDQHSVYEKMVAKMARNGRITRDKNAFGIYRGAFSTTLTNDGVSLVNDAHVTVKGFTVDNNIELALTEASLDTAITALTEQKGQDGLIEGAMPAVLLVPSKLYKTAVEITEAELRSNTGGSNDGVNEPNVYSSKYGIEVRTSPFLGSAAGGSDTAWFLLADMHGVSRWKRQDIQTTLVDWKFQRNNNYIYKGEYREVVGAEDYAGIVGTDGVA